jgi:DNA-binding protein HU-beta
VDGLLDTIVAAVGAGDSVSITGFGVFEPRARAARVARNPRTGAAVDVAATTVPAFRPGAAFRAVVGGTASAPAPRAVPARAGAAATAAEAGEAAAPGGSALNGSGPDVEAPAAEGGGKRARKATRGRAFAARPTPEQPVPDLEPAATTATKAEGKGKAKAGKETKAKAGKEKAGKEKESGKESGKSRKAKGKK